MPSSTFASTSTSTTGRWLKTTLSNRGSTTAEQAEIYSDVDAPENILFADSDLNEGMIVERDGTTSTDVVVDSTGKVVGWIPAATLNTICAMHPRAHSPARPARRCRSD